MGLYNDLYTLFKRMRFSHLVSEDLAERATDVAARHIVTPLPADDNGLRMAAGQWAWANGKKLDTADIPSPFYAYGWCYSALMDLRDAIVYGVKQEDLDKLCQKLEGVLPPTAFRGAGG